MSLPRQVRTVLTTGLALALAAPVLAVASAVPATAVAAGQATVARPGPTAPKCVSRKFNKWKSRVEVRNNCARGHWLKVYAAHGNDSQCLHYKEGQRRDHYTVGSGIDAVRIC